MATLIKLPQFGVTMTEATVVAWLKSVGDTVERGDAVANIETDKLNQEVMATASGILRRIVVPVGGVAKVMEALAVLGAASEPESAIDAALGVAAPVVPSTKTEPAKAPASASSSTAPTRAEDERAAVRASPLARRLAGELGGSLRAGRWLDPCFPAGPTAGQGRRHGPGVRHRERPGRPDCRTRHSGPDRCPRGVGPGHDFLTSSRSGNASTCTKHCRWWSRCCTGSGRPYEARDRPD